MKTVETIIYKEIKTLKDLEWFINHLKTDTDLFFNPKTIEVTGDEHEFAGIALLETTDDEGKKIEYIKIYS